MYATTTLTLVLLGSSKIALMYPMLHYFSLLYASHPCRFIPHQHYPCRHYFRTFSYLCSLHPRRVPCLQPFALRHVPRRCRCVLVLRLLQPRIIIQPFSLRYSLVRLAFPVFTLSVNPMLYYLSRLYASHKRAGRSCAGAASKREETPNADKPLLRAVLKQGAFFLTCTIKKT